MNDLCQKKREIFESGTNLDRVIEQIRSILNPEQVGKFLVWLETSQKDKSSLSVFELWNIPKVSVTPAIEKPAGPESVEALIRELDEGLIDSEGEE